jgi:hypothetical protein
MPQTTLEKLTSVQAAIAAIEGGAQEYQLDNDIRYRRADLKVLYAREEKLQAQYNRETGSTSDVTVAYFTGR